MADERRLREHPQVHGARQPHILKKNVKPQELTSSTEHKMKIYMYCRIPNRHNNQNLPAPSHPPNTLFTASAGRGNVRLAFPKLDLQQGRIAGIRLRHSTVRQFSCHLPESVRQLCAYGSAV